MTLVITTEELWQIQTISIPVSYDFLQYSNKQLLDEVEQNIVICQWRVDQLFADAEGRGK